MNPIRISLVRTLSPWSHKGYQTPHIKPAFGTALVTSRKGSPPKGASGFSHTFVRGPASAGISPIPAESSYVCPGTGVFVKRETMMSEGFGKIDRRQFAK